MPADPRAHHMKRFRFIAGGYDALYKASEASEDDEQAGAQDLENAASA